MKSRLFCKTATALAATVLATGTVYAQQAAGTQPTETETPRAKDDTVRLGTITVVGSGAKLGSGLMINDDSVKGRSTVTKASLEKDRSTGNSYQAIALLPGVNTYNYDATGLFGGGLSIRGFNSDQLGFTVNGVPVNDSGNFAVYPQEFIDTENVCTTSVAQGSTELESPSGGASGGSVGIITCDPSDTRRLRVSQTLGGLSMSRTYLRADSGRFMDGKAKVFLSVSHTEADKWKGEGKAKKDHVDFGFSLDLSEDNKILGSVLYNRAVNNNIYSISLAQLNANGYYYDFATTFKPRLTPGAGAQTETGMNPIFWKTSLNPFENVIASVSGSFKVAPDTYLKVQPYMWYGFGNGGWSEVALNETTGLLGGAKDVNGDGDTLDVVRVGRASVTRTQRPGVTAELSTTWENHYLKFGLWFERAKHRQTQPAVQLNADGSPSDMWLREGCIQRVNGSCYQGRDWSTVSTAHQAYFNDQISFANDRGLISVGIRVPTVQRDVTNFASETTTRSFASATATTSTNVSQDYRIKRSFTEVLPQLGIRFNVDPRVQVFANVAKNFRAPSNFAYTGSNVRFVAGAIQPYAEVKAETSIMSDFGFRYQSPAVSLGATLFNSNFRDRQANAVDPNTLTNVYTNAGRVRTRGLEVEAGTGVFSGFSAYASVTIQESLIQDNLRVSTAVTLPTAGKEFTLTPRHMAGLSLQYEQGPFYARAKAKYSGSQQATLMNDEVVPSYKTVDLDVGYKVGDLGFAKNAQLRFNVSNLTNTKYRNPSSGTVTNAVAYQTQAAQGVFYYLGAPRLSTVTFSADFE
jgi:iron complex outermembrane receptor protein